MLRLRTALVLICSPLVALAAPRHLDSPGKVLSVEIDTDPDGRPGYRVMRNGKPVMAPSRLRFILVAPKFERNLVLGIPVIRSFDETWEQPWGERRSIRNHYNELRVTLTERTAPRRSFEVVFRVYDDGVGFRYAFPDQPQLKDIKISEALTEFNLADETTAWWNDAFGWNREEYLYHRTPIEEVGDAQTPITLRTKVACTCPSTKRHLRQGRAHRVVQHTLAHAAGGRTPVTSSNPA